MHERLLRLCACSQASRGGDTTVRLYWNQAQARDIYYARYIDWCALTCATGIPYAMGLFCCRAVTFIIFLDSAVAQVHHHAAAPPRPAAAVRRVCQYSGLVRPATGVL